MKILMEVSSESFTEEELLVCKLEQNCLKIINSENTNNYKKYVLNIIQDFDFDKDYNEYENISLKKVDLETKHLAISIVNRLKNVTMLRKKLKFLKKKKKLRQKRKILLLLI